MWFRVAKVGSAIGVSKEKGQKFECNIGKATQLQDVLEALMGI